MRNIWPPRTTPVGVEDVLLLRLSLFLRAYAASFSLSGRPALRIHTFRGSALMEHTTIVPSLLAR
ncbi:MAG TPA: hypothetical protein VNN62_06575 [Methylomirabilota bacterium]|nr:hypothetical protein [Methylomirabilota bacterium]